REEDQKAGRNCPKRFVLSYEPQASKRQAGLTACLRSARPFVPGSGTSSCEGQELLDLCRSVTHHRSQEIVSALLELLENNRWLAEHFVRRYRIMCNPPHGIGKIEHRKVSGTRFRVGVARILNRDN